MIGKNKMVLNQQEMCRLLSLAISADTLKDEKIKVKEISISKSSSGYDQTPEEFSVTVEGEAAGSPPF